MTLLKAEHITKKYSGRTIIEDISIDLQEGELVSLLGVSGAGKTTLFHVLSGLVAPEEGRVLLSGEDITAKPGRISYMMQKDLLLPHKKIIDNVSLPLVLKGEKKKDAREKADPLLRSLVWKVPSISTQVSFPAACASGRRCFVPTCHPTA